MFSMNKGFLFKCALLSTLVLSSVTQAKVWNSEQTWNEEWENKYATWIQNEFNDDVFMKGAFAGIATDCADAVYAARVIFSAQNKLPFLISGGASNSTSRFDNISDPTKRLRAFIQYVGDDTSTQSLPNDTYPVAINAQSLKPGIIWLRSSYASENFFVRLFAGPNAPSGHTEVIKNISPSGIIYLMGSTVPAKVRNLLTVTSLAFLPDNNNLGFRRWIWPQNRNMQPSEMPNYSLEQFSMGVPTQANNNNCMDCGASSGNTRKSIQEFTTQIQARLALQAETKPEYFERMAKDLCSMIQLRHEVVQDALKYKKDSGQCMTSDAYENFSTPSRDKRIKDWLKQMLDASGGGLFSSASKRLEKLSSYFLTCADLKLQSGESLKIADALTAFAKGNVSSNPNDSELARWGLDNSKTTCSGK